MSKYRVAQIDEGIWGVEQKILLWWFRYSLVNWEIGNNFPKLPERIPLTFTSIKSAEEFVELLNT